MVHTDLAAEQRYLDTARVALAAMAERTSSVLEATDAATEADSEVARWHLRRRLDTLVDRDDVVAFGRIDDPSDRWYVGRRHIETDDGDPLVVDWRAPVSIPFYRATALDHMGLDRRRRYTADGATLLDIIEEAFDDPDGALVSGAIPDPLLAELERERSGAMRDIVATIAAEQDEIIRAPLDRLLVVQGGPGTGKTAVALHRAAFLLFEHRMTLIESGVLVVGPNPVFLRYVADVLPSLGETSVRQTTIEGLRAAGLRVGEADGADVGRVKGDARMADVIAAAIAGTIKLPAETVRISSTWGRIVLEPGDVAAAAAETLARKVPHATGRESFRNQLLHRAYEIHAQVAEVPALKTNFLAGARRDPAFRKFIDRTWPLPSAPTLVQKLLGSKTTRRRAATGILDAAEAELLGRKVARRVADERWSPADLALLDEAEDQLNGIRARYGHIVVDEAQDLSAMALRAVARRSTTGSMTIVGDLAQGTQPWAQSTWDTVVGALRGPAPVQQSELTVGYRTPAPILDLANRLLPDAAPAVTPARSIRATGTSPIVDAAVDGDLAGAVVGHATRLVAERGTTAVVAATHEIAGLAGALDAAGVRWSSTVVDADRVALLTPLGAKGLEFDAVVVVEPATIVRAEPSGVRALFVALSRPTRELVVVHHEPLPDALAG